MEHNKTTSASYVYVDLFSLGRIYIFKFFYFLKNKYLSFSK